MNGLPEPTQPIKDGQAQQKTRPAAADIAQRNLPPWRALNPQNDRTDGRTCQNDQQHKNDQDRPCRKDAGSEKSTAEDDLNTFRPSCMTGGMAPA